MALDKKIAEFYSRPGRMTEPGAQATAFEGLPHGLGDAAKIVQGFMLHEHWAPAYRQNLTPERRAESQLRSTERILAHTFAKNPQPLTSDRPLYQRTVGVCRHFTVVTVALLRRQGIPARARCGFGAYFNKGKFEDHWVTEYWDGTRWKLADTQIDAAQRAILSLDMNLFDVPRDRFVIAGDAWLQCRSGRADPGAFGIFEMRGLWFIAGNVIRDFAALNNMEMLPWDNWGAMTGPDKPLTDETNALLDRVAALTLDPDAHFDELRALYESDSRLHVPAQVFNIATKAKEAV
jgi:hypothetical protein